MEIVYADDDFAKQSQVDPNKQQRPHERAYETSTGRKAMIAFGLALDRF